MRLGPDYCEGSFVRTTRSAWDDRIQQVRCPYCGRVLTKRTRLQQTEDVSVPRHKKPALEDDER